MAATTIRYTCFPLTQPPPEFIAEIISVFKSVEGHIGTELTKQRMKSNIVLGHLAKGLSDKGFTVEKGKKHEDKIHRPVFYGENGIPTLRYEVDAYHATWRCGLEVEAVRALRGGAVYRDLVQAMIMVQVDHLCLAVPNYMKVTKAPDKAYDETIRIVEALYGHTRIKMPYGITVIGY